MPGIGCVLPWNTANIYSNLGVYPKEKNHSAKWITLVYISKTCRETHVNHHSTLNRTFYLMCSSTTFKYLVLSIYHCNFISWYFKFIINCFFILSTSLSIPLDNYVTPESSTRTVPDSFHKIILTVMQLQGGHVFLVGSSVDFLAPFLWLLPVPWSLGNWWRSEKARQRFEIYTISLILISSNGG